MAVEQGADVAPDDVRSAIAGELGEPVVGPNDPAPPDAGRIEVRSHSGVIHVAYRDARGHTIERELTAPADGATRVRMIALLAGNLARNEAADLVTHPDPDAADAPKAAPAGGADSQSHVKVDVAPGEELRVRIVPAALQKADDVAPAPAPTPIIPPSSGSEGSTQRTLGWIGIGTGVAAVGAGIALRVMGSNQPSTIAACPSAGCSPKGIFPDDSTQPKIVASNWAFAVGAALAATGVILELTAPSSTPSTRIAIGPTGVVLSRGW
ncbi:MAG TPA: hypothetical protein VF765_11520 [Polyangiaceae bacterium]